MKRKKRIPRPTQQTAGVLLAFAKRPASWRHGYGIGREARVESPSIYVVLRRQEELGHLESKWEKGTSLKRSRRHLYRLTAAGRALAKALKSGEVVATKRPRRYKKSAAASGPDGAASRGSSKPGRPR